MEPITVAAAAVGYLAPYLPELAKGAATKIGENVPEAAGKLFDWLRGQLSPGGQEAIDDLAQAPDDGDSRKALELQIGKTLRRDPRLAEDLASLLPAEVRTTVAQNQDVSGAGAKAAQVAGSHKTTSIG